MIARLTTGLNLALGMTIVLAVGLAGFKHTSPGIIPPFGAVYTVLFIHGKWPAWRLLWQQKGIAGWAKAGVGTFVTQLLLVGVLYLVGYGLGAVLGASGASHAFTANDLLLPLGVLAFALGGKLVIQWLESRAGTEPARAESVVPPATIASDSAITGVEPELLIDPKPVDPDSFFSARHFSRSNFSRVALTDIVDHQGEKPKRVPRDASETMLAATEQRLGVRLPEPLRSLYRRQNGGYVGCFWVANKPQPQAIYADWDDAFANDYNELKPLEGLRTLHDLYLEDFDPGYGEDEKHTWLPNSEKYVVLAIRYESGTALDYTRGPEPGVVLFDLEQDGDARIRLRFDSFDAFFSALRREVPDQYEADQAIGGPPDPARPDRFWKYDGRIASRGIDQTEWREVGDRLGVDLPEELRVYFQAADGGLTLYASDPQIPRTRGGSLGTPFPEESDEQRGEFLPIGRWVSLQTLSDRLDFIDERRPWAEIWDRPDRLIVVAAAFDASLMLDYRQGRVPAVLGARNLDDPADCLRYDSVAEFLMRLRIAGDPNRPIRDLLGDPRLSARKPCAETFWLTPGENPPLDPAERAAAEARWDARIPDPLAGMLAVQNGGAVRFRFLPPEELNAYGYWLSFPERDAWIDLFPGGILPLARWRLWDDWCRDSGVFPPPSESTLLSQSMSTDPNIEARLWVIGRAKTAGGFRITLLDLSRSYFRREASLLLADFDGATGRLAVVIGHKSLTNVFHGVLGQLRALRDDRS